MRSSVARELRLIIAATGLLTRLPLPPTPHEADWLPRCAKYLPVVGALVGLFAAAILLLSGLIWPDPIPAILAIVATLIVTGALHEDGLADTFDGFGGRTREARLAIMKDSRLGAYGALALIGCLALRAASLATMPPGPAAASLVAAHAGARLAVALVMAAQPYAGDPGTAKIAQTGGRPRPAELAVAATFGLLPLCVMPPASILPALLVGGGAAALLAWRTGRALGGQTGDTLGAAEAVFETAFLLGAAAAFGRPAS